MDLLKGSKHIVHSLLDISTPTDCVNFKGFISIGLASYIALDYLAVTNSHTKPLVFAILPVLLLAWFTTVEYKLAPGTCLEQQVRAVTGADTAVGALSLVTWAGLVGFGASEGPNPWRGSACKKRHDMCVTILRSDTY